MLLVASTVLGVEAPREYTELLYHLEHRFNGRKRVYVHIQMLLVWALEN